jgi:DNA-binding winged helix-turn-helix (wHTH) protein
MATSHAGRTARIARFGVFEVNLAAGELRKNGARIGLQEQPFQLLILLLERAPDVISREEITKKLWSPDVFVDFDKSLNTAVNKVREALGDSATNPKYVETLAKRGYRFLAPVVWISGPDPVPPDPPVPPFRPPPRRVTRALFELIQLMYLIFYVEALFHLREIDRVADTFLPGWASFAIVAATIVTAGVGIPVRCYLLSTAAFDYKLLGEKFQQLFLFILILDELWGIAPFLLAQKIGFGAAFAATAGLLYVPFSERTLIEMAYPKMQLTSSGALG